MMRGLVIVMLALTACAGGPTGAVSTTPSPSPTAAVVAAAIATPPVPAGGVRFVATPFKGAATVKVEEHLAVNLVTTDAVLTSNGVDGALKIGRAHV